ncbi:hypothetical protein [Melittangium boletus]|uniref:Uncharacterized protein n=1 Tax=Melittangium boletus DSM 14713 TaxID=1294270 RepID=A0A250IH50_9BACT|nr:hypothetical protein [Melittangium boletus]ATB30492.1 hypothetical protein MEBOL_003953 [Melittangium boletus DSM 14713]
MTAKKTTRLALVGMLAGALSLGAGTAFAQSPSSSTGSVQTTPPGGSTGQTSQPGTGSTTDDVQRDQGLAPPTDSLGTGGSGTDELGTGNLPQQGDAIDPSRNTGGSDTTLSPGTTEPAPLTPDSNWGGTGGSGTDMGSTGTQDPGANTPGQGTIQPSPSDQSDLNTTEQGQVNPGTTDQQTR